MPTEQTIAIQFKGQKSKLDKPATMLVRSFTEKEQKIRAIKTILKFWGIALLCVLIPIAHFILVPLFFIMGIMKAAKLLHKAEDGLHAEGDCPACEQHIQFNLDNNAELPQWLNCPKCSEVIELHH